MILECVYEPIFSEHSHGFRPNRSCHTALESIHKTWKGTKWFIEADIKGYFDNINHKLLSEMLKEKIDDRKFAKVMEKMLKAGVMEDWKFEKTFSGTPQGGIISPILANIYLHRLDTNMEDIVKRFNRGKRRKTNPEYKQIDNQKYQLGRKIQKAKGKGEPYIHLVRRIKELTEKQLNTPCQDECDPEYARVKYIRYADDFLIGIIGSKELAKQVKKEVETIINTQLKLELSQEKTGIKYYSDGVRFLGYELDGFNSKAVKKVQYQGTDTKRRTGKGIIGLFAPIDKLAEYAKKKGWGNFHTMKTIHCPELLNNSDLEIIQQYNAEMRGIANYYALAINFDVYRLIRIGQMSLFKTLAVKHKTRSVNKILKRLKYNKGQLTLNIDGKEKEYRVVQARDINRIKPHKVSVDNLPLTQMYKARTDLVERIKAQVCEYCGKDSGNFEVHHIRKLKDIKDGKELWQKHMIARNRKTMVLCVECHDLLHAGKLPDKRYLLNNKVDSRVQ